MSISGFLPLALAAIPGLYAWWRGGRLLAHLDDPAFSEMLMAHTGRVIKVLVVVWAITIVLASRQAAWGLPLALIAMLVGGFPLRRRAFEENWSLGLFLSHQIRFAVGAFGSWFAVLLAPTLYALGVVPLEVAAPILITVVSLWSVFGGRILLRLVRATPLERHALSTGFDRIVARADCKKPVVYRAGPKGGRWVNGFALPSPWAPAVLLTDDLLDNLELAEAHAIFAHEVAHLEQFTFGRWLIRVIAGPLLTVGVSLAYLWIAPGSASFHPLFLAWPFVCVVTLVALLSRSQRDETESDLRAVELTGDPEVMISALTKLHLLIRQPRRFGATHEQRVSHPSLARRIQAIRQAYDQATYDQVETLVIRSASADGTIVQLMPDRLQWLEGVPPDVETSPETYWQHSTRARSIAYAELAELRVDASRPNRRDLVVVDRKKEKTTIRLSLEDASRVQQFLDRIDHHLGVLPEHAVKHPLLVSSAIIRWFAVIGAIGGVFPPTSLALSIACVLVALRPVTAITIGAGVIGLLTSWFAWTNGTSSAAGFEQQSLGLLVQLMVSVVFLGVGIARLKAGIDERPQDVHAIIALLLLAGLLGVFVKAAAFIGPLATMHVHLWVRSGPTALLLLVGGAVALTIGRHLITRVAGIVLALLLVATFAAGTSAFRTQFTNDILRESAPLVTPSQATTSTIRSVTLHQTIIEIGLSPSGERFAARVDNWSEPQYRHLPSVFVIEGQDSVEQLIAVAVRWTSDSSVLALISNDHGLLLSHSVLGTGSVWSLQLPDVADPLLQVRDDAWSVTSNYRSESGFGELHGTIGSDDVKERRWQIFESEQATISQLLADQNGRALALGSALNTDFIFPGVIFGLGVPTLNTELWLADSVRTTPLGQTALMLSCLERSAQYATYACVAAHGGVTELWRLDANHATLQPTARINGWRWASGTSDAYVLQEWEQDLFVVDAEPLRIRKVARTDLFPMSQAIGNGDLSLGETTPWVHAVAYRNGTLVIATGDYDDTIVTFYRVSD